MTLAIIFREHLTLRGWIAAIGTVTAAMLLVGGQLIAALLMVFSLVVVFRERNGHIHQHGLISHQHIHRHDEPHHNHELDDLEANMNHSHWHEHQPMEHDHKHWPDLHHRHAHKDSGED